MRMEIKCYRNEGDNLLNSSGSDRLEWVPTRDKSAVLPIWKRKARPKSERHGWRESTQSPDPLITSHIHNP